MSSGIYTAFANASGTATVEVPEVPGGLQWIIWQITVETNPVRSSALATVRRDGQYITSTISGSGSSAQGPPALVYGAGNKLTIVWTGLTVKDEVIATLLYEQVNAGEKGSAFGLV